MDDFFHFTQNPTLSAQTEPKNTVHVSIVTSEDKFKASHGEFRATQLKNAGFQQVYEGEKATFFFSKPTESLTLKEAELVAISLVDKVKATKVGAIDLSVDAELTPAQWGQLYYCITLANYKFQMKAIEENKNSYVTQINLVGAPEGVLEHTDFTYYQVLANGKAHARDLQNGRVNVINTTQFHDIAQKFAAKHDKVDITSFVGKELWEQGLRLHYSVGKGSQYPPIFVNLKYTGNPSSEEYHALVGKGVVFDSGGTDVKSGPFLFWMFLDKGGACSVYGAFKAVVEAGLKVNVTCSIPLAENALDGESYRTSDIIKSHSGKTVEITNTDAEGRLLLCDAMSWTQQNYKLKSMVELSTLTGASIVALGHEYACMMSNHDCLVKELQDAGSAIRESLWRLPLLDYVRKRLKTGPADLKNSSCSKDAGTIEAGAYLENFVHEGVRWAHVDIAATTINYGARFGPYNQGGTGFGVGFLYQYFKNLADKN